MLSTATPRLMHFRLDPGGSQAVLSACLSTVHAVPKLRSLHLASLQIMSLPALRLLSSMKDIDSLHFAITGIYPTDFCGFRNLRTLHMYVVDGSALPILHAYSSPNLQRLVLMLIAWEAPRDPDDAKLTAQMLAQRFPSMESLYWQFVIVDTEPLETTLHPLFALHLREVVFTFHLASFRGVSDSFFGEVAKAWKRLTRLSVVSSPFSRGPIDPSESETSSHVLSIHAKGCPHLEELELWEMKVVHTEEQALERPVQGHPLRSLKVVNFAATSAEEHACALLIDRLFPALEVAKTPKPGKEIWLRWYKVLREVYTFQRRRYNPSS